eukprot:m.192600 g.192600  ORF g.192600 m.192600 type:complete len:462 (-) comp18695_c0_seq1:73-1458(-)
MRILGIGMQDMCQQTRAYGGMRAHTPSRYTGSSMDPHGRRVQRVSMSPLMAMMAVWAIAMPAWTHADLSSSGIDATRVGDPVPVWARGTLHTSTPHIDTLERVMIVIVRKGAWVPNSDRNDGGVADRLTGIVTHLAAAVAANATFRLEWPGITKYYRPRFDFMISPEETNQIVSSDLLRLPGLQQFPFQGNFRGLKLLRSLQTRKVTTARAAHGFLHCFWNVGKVYKPRGCIAPDVWQTPRLAAMREAMSFRDAYRTLFDTLFEPTELLQKALSTVARRILKPDVPPSEGGRRFMLQVRMGDHHMVSENAKGSKATTTPGLLATARAFFACAERQEKARGLDPQKVVWFVMSDSETLKRLALERYPDKVVVNTLGRATLSTSYLTHNESKGKRQDPLADPMLHVMAEQWVGTQCDMHIVTRMSGLGREAAFRSYSTEEQVCYGNDCSCFSWYGVAMDWSEI